MICQVERIAMPNTLLPKLVKIPGILVDCVVVAQNPAVSHMMTYATLYNPALSGEIRVPMDNLPIMPLNEVMTLESYTMGYILTIM